MRCHVAQLGFIKVPPVYPVGLRPVRRAGGNVSREVSTQREVREVFGSSAEGRFTTAKKNAGVRGHACDPVLWETPLPRFFLEAPEPFCIDLL